MKQTLAFVLVPAIALLLGGAVQVGRPLPALALSVAPGPITLPGRLAVTYPAQGQVAVGEASLGVMAETANQEPVPIASLTKMMTAYLLLQARPLKRGEDGPVTVLSAADVATYQKDRAAGDSVLRVSAGEKLTERQLLEALLLPSADNIATLIADQVAGGEAAFVVKMNEAAKGLGMSQTTYADAAGVSASTASTAHDQILMAKAVMQNRTIREIVAQPQALLPVAGVVYNVNFMVGKQGISGIKTGSTLAAGSCFVGSYPITVDGKPRILLGAVLGQRSLHDALTYDAQLLHSLAPQVKTFAVSAPAGGFAQLGSAWQKPVPLKPAQPVRVFGYPGMPVTLAARLKPAALPIQAGQGVATLAVGTGDAGESVELRAAQGVPSAGVLWRLHRWPVAP